MYHTCLVTSQVWVQLSYIWWPVTCERIKPCVDSCSQQGAPTSLKYTMHILHMDKHHAHPHAQRHKRYQTDKHGCTQTEVPKAHTNFRIQRAGGLSTYCAPFAKTPHRHREGPRLGQELDFSLEILVELSMKRTKRKM